MIDNWWVENANTAGAGEFKDLEPLHSTNYPDIKTLWVEKEKCDVADCKFYAATTVWDDEVQSERPICFDHIKDFMD